MLEVYQTASLFMANSWNAPPLWDVDVLQMDTNPAYAKSPPCMGRPRFNLGVVSQWDKREMRAAEYNGCANNIQSCRRLRHRTSFIVPIVH
jgi:hypothetical protein